MYFENRKTKKTDQYKDLKEFQANFVWLFNAESKNKAHELDIEVQINNNMDVCLRIRQVKAAKK